MTRNIIKRYKTLIILIGDCLVFFGALSLTLSLRYGPEEYASAFRAHALPFALLLVIWLAVFYIADLYTYTTWRTTFENGKRFALALLVNFFLSISIFYLFGSFFKLTPKLNLAIFSVLFGVLDCVWRFSLARLLASKNNTHRVIVLSDSPLVDTILAYAKKYPESGYDIERAGTPEEARAVLEKIPGKALIIVDRCFIQDPSLMAAAYARMSDTVRIETLANFYAEIFKRIPLSEISEEWILEEVTPKQNVYDLAKRATDVALAAFLLVLFSPLFVLFAILVPLTSKGPAIYRQERIGRGGKHFTIYKFRNMYHDLARNPDLSGTAPVWWQKDDPRVTPLGRMLRKSHLDELPQLWNILWGDMSFVGPRPERPEFVATLKEQIPHYLARQTIKPGLTGWAQIKFRYASTVMEWHEKFEYDLYYVKNRSFFIDIGVIAKTIHFVFMK